MFLEPVGVISVMNIEEASIVATSAKNAILHSEFHAALHNEIKEWPDENCIQLVTTIDGLRGNSKGQLRLGSLVKDNF